MPTHITTHKLDKMGCIMRSIPTVLPGWRLVESYDVVTLQRTFTSVTVLIIWRAVDGVCECKSSVGESFLRESLEPITCNAWVPDISIILRKCESQSLTLQKPWEHTKERFVYFAISSVLLSNCATWRIAKSSKAYYERAVKYAHRHVKETSESIPQVSYFPRGSGVQH